MAISDPCYIGWRIDCSYYKNRKLFQQLLHGSHFFTDIKTWKTSINSLKSELLRVAQGLRISYYIGLLRKEQQIKPPSPNPAGSVAATSSPRRGADTAGFLFFFSRYRISSGERFHAHQKIERSEVFEESR